MPRDSRPYTTYPVNYTTHPRWEGLSDAAFRTLHEMQDHSRVHGLDGLVPIPIARKKWRRKALDELVAGAPGTDRPLLELLSNGYFIRSYDEHQMTTADVADLRKKRSEAGSLGGKAKANGKQLSSKYVASASRKGKQNVAESKSELEIERLDSDIPPVLESSPVTDVSAEGLDPSLVALVQERTSAKAWARRYGVKDLYALHGILETAVESPMTEAGAMHLIDGLLAKSPRQVRDVDAYVATVCRKTPETVREIYQSADLGAIA